MAAFAYLSEIFESFLFLDYLNLHIRIKENEGWFGGKYKI